MSIKGKRSGQTLLRTLLRPKYCIFWFWKADLTLNLLPKIKNAISQPHQRPQKRSTTHCFPLWTYKGVLKYYISRFGQSQHGKSHPQSWGWRRRDISKSYFGNKIRLTDLSLWQIDFIESCSFIASALWFWTLPQTALASSSNAVRPPTLKVMM